MSHPAPEILALFAGGDLHLLRRIAVSLHLRGCRQCAQDVAGLQSARSELKSRSLAMPAGVDWDRLSLEMRANIRLGLTAGAIVDAGLAGRRWRAGQEAWSWRLGVVTASLGFVVLAGWMLQPAKNGVQPAPRASLVMLETNRDGLALQDRGAAMTLLNPEKTAVTTTVSWDGGARASFIDADTGQVTIHHVAAQ